MINDNNDDGDDNYNNNNNNDNDSHNNETNANHDDPLSFLLLYNNWVAWEDTLKQSIAKSEEAKRREEHLQKILDQSSSESQFAADKLKELSK